MSSTRKVEAFLAYVQEEVTRHKRTNETYLQSKYELDFSKQNVKDEDLEKLLPTFNSLVSPVVKVDFSNNPISDKGVQAISNWLSTAQSQIKTEVLLHGVKLSTASCGVLFKLKDKHDISVTLDALPVPSKSCTIL